MTNIYILTIKNTGAKYVYTALTPVFILHNKETLGVAKSTLEKYDFDIKNYENEKIVIEKLVALSTTDARKQVFT